MKPTIKLLYCALLDTDFIYNHSEGFVINDGTTTVKNVHFDKYLEQDLMYILGITEKPKCWFNIQKASSVRIISNVFESPSTQWIDMLDIG